MGTLRGGYVALKETAPLELIILASGSELQWAMDAAKELGGAVRVVSMPCFERFERQDDAYKAEVLPPCVARRVAIEAGVSGLWYKYAVKVIGTDQFGFSAPGGTVMDAFGINVKHLLAVAEVMLQEGKEEARARKRRSSKERRSSKKNTTQSAIWSQIECKTLDSLPEFSHGNLKSGTLDSLPEFPDDDSSVEDSVSEAGSEDIKQKTVESPPRYFDEAFVGA
jgi:pyruvate dehydrogenase complex dehydrogenase (E1) component